MFINWNFVIFGNCPLSIYFKILQIQHHFHHLNLKKLNVSRCFLVHLSFPVTISLSRALNKSFSSSKLFFIHFKIATITFNSNIHNFHFCFTVPFVHTNLCKILMQYSTSALYFHMFFTVVVGIQWVKVPRMFQRHFQHAATAYYSML